MRRLATVLTLILALSGATLAGDRVPGDHWMKYADPSEAGFDPAKLEAARESWEQLESSAFLVVADGAVVAAWGDHSRRFMCHSVRKSFLSALFGIYWDRQEIDLNKTLFDLGIDDSPDPLLDSERQARTLDLLKARSGIFHPAAYAGRTDSAERGSKGAGRYFAYNNWDFNTLATILMQETGDDVFEAFDEHFGDPLQMEDWRVSDGYYHYERDKSRYPAYPFRLSARDAARFGLLFTREGQWGDDRILSKHWVRRSSAMYSIDDEIRGYGFMWWIYREPRFERHGMYAALGVGNQLIAALPESDLVIVNRADTYEGERTPDAALNDLIAQVLAARTGSVAPDPKLVPLEEVRQPGVTSVPTDRLLEYAGKWAYPPEWLGLPRRTWVAIEARDGHLQAHSPVSGTFKLYLQPDGSFHEEDSRDRYFPLRDDEGRFVGISGSDAIVTAAIDASVEGNRKRGAELFGLLESEEGVGVEVGRAVSSFFDGGAERAERALTKRAESGDAAEIEARVNRIGYRFLTAGKNIPAVKIFAMNTRLFPDASNAWDSLGEAQMTIGERENAIRSYEKSLELDPRNENAVRMIAKMRDEE